MFYLSVIKMIRKILWWILSIIVAIGIFVFVLCLFPKKNKLVWMSPSVELTYIFVDEYGNEYDIFSNQWHWAATDWSFLFQDDDSKWESNEVSEGDKPDQEKRWTTIVTKHTTIYTGDNGVDSTGDKTELTWDELELTWGEVELTWNEVSQVEPWSTNPVSIGIQFAWIKLIQQQLTQDLWEKAYKLQIPYELLQQDPELVSLILGSQIIRSDEDKQAWLLWILTMTPDQVENLRNTLVREKEKLRLLELKYGSGLWNTDNVWIVKNTSKTNHTYKNCVTPWNVVVQHWDYVLAYQQRSDVPDICNVQKRVCRDWVLNGTYTQWYCNEDIPYQYTKVAATEYNKKDPSQLVQNPRYAKYDWADYDKYGKINWSGNVPTTIWDNESTPDAIKHVNSVSLNNKTFLNCIAPWWDIVIHGQFVKAYASPLGFTDDWCKVELRLCMDGELQWNYAYSKCKYTNISYSDYIDGDKTIYDLYNEAYNLADTSTENNAELLGVYQDLDVLYGDATSQSHNMVEDETVEWFSISFLRQIWNWLSSIFE